MIMYPLVMTFMCLLQTGYPAGGEDGMGELVFLKFRF